jgi:hypothetical protein
MYAYCAGSYAGICHGASFYFTSIDERYRQHLPPLSPASSGIFPATFTPVFMLDLNECLPEGRANNLEGLKPWKALNVTR